MRKKMQRKIRGFNDQTKVKQPTGEQCQRCKEWGEDRRTLWHACMYAMHENETIPFEQVQIEGHVVKQVGEENLDFLGPGHAVPIFDVIPEDAEMRAHRFYTLRVCKDCRASWLDALATWFAAAGEFPESIGSGIFVRRNGVNVEISHEEWETLQKTKAEPEDFPFEPQGTPKGKN